MLLTQQEASSLMTRFDTLIDKLRIDERDRKGLNKLPSFYSVIVKIKKTTPLDDENEYKVEMGRVSYGGSFHSYFSGCEQGSTYLREQLLDDMMVIFRKFKEDNPRKNQLFFRYNQKKSFDIFSASTMATSSRLFRYE